MLGLTILSPHYDDAAFSLTISLSRWSELPMQLTVANFFTQTEYAPHALSTHTSPVSAIRKREDRLALRLIDRRIRIESLGFIDAPLRFGISPEAVSRPHIAALRQPAEIDSMTERIHKYFMTGVVLSPLGLGDHVDHLAVKQAAVASSTPYRLGFYEDLPYASWISKSALCLRLREVERSIRIMLRPAIIRSRNFTPAHKRQVISRYFSQVSFDTVTAIVEYASNYGGGERVWIPTNSARWKAIVE
jgi:hypothetical protein